jgi:hypothetical protein
VRFKPIAAPQHAMSNPFPQFQRRGNAITMRGA